MRWAPTMAILVAFGLGASSHLEAQIWEVGNQLLKDPTWELPSSYFGGSLVAGDFDGDGFADVVVRSRSANNGALILFRGSATGLAAAPGGEIQGTADKFPFGSVLAAGNFDADAADELVVGNPSAVVTVGDTEVLAGEVEIYDWTGGAWSLVATFSQETPGVPGGGEAYDYFGAALASGDFDADGYLDLAVGASGESIGSTPNAGAVNILYGSPAGLATAGAQVWYRSGGNLTGIAAADAYLGRALAAGDFDGDGADDLAIGVPGAVVDNQGGSGEVVVLFGAEGDGLVATGQLGFDATDLGDAAVGQAFGSRLAAADFDPDAECADAGDCADELAIGAPYSTVNFGSPVSYAGRVWLPPGSVAANGPDLAGASWIDQSELFPLQWTAPESGDHFGISLAVGRLDPDGAADLAVGSTGESLGELDDAGCVHLLSGGSLPLEPQGAQYLFARPEFASAPLGASEQFGGALAIGDFDGDSWGDLAVGVPARWESGVFALGAVQVLYGALFADGFERGDPGAWTLP